MIKNNLKYNDYYKYIDPKYLGLRAENLSIEDFINITNSITYHIDNDKN